MTITAHIDRQSKTIDGVHFQNTHSGQKRAYGDSYYEYQVRSDLPQAEVERICREKIYKCAMTDAEWREKGKTDRSMDHAFTPHYVFRKMDEGKYFYQVHELYTD